MTKLQIVILILYNFISLGQTDSTNRLNSAGKKIGYWKLYLDEKAMPTDSANSYLWGYEFFDNDKIPFRRFIKEQNVSRYKIVYEGELKGKGQPTIINGVIKWFEINNGKETLYLEDKFENGYAQVFKQYDRDGKPWMTCDFTKKYNDIQGTLFIEFGEGVRTMLMQKAGKRWFIKKKHRWKYIRA